MPNYRSLRADKIIETQQRLRARIDTRFPGSGLSGVAAELQAVAETAAVRAEEIRRPYIGLRLIVAALLLGAAAIVVAVAQSIRVKADLLEASTLVQFVEAGLAGLVLVGAAVLTLVTLEIRLKRRRALGALHELRAIAHVVDMHQLAKDPEGVMHRVPVTTESPKQQTTKTLLEVNRYLNYCNELLAIISKIAALYVQDFPDTSTVAAVDDIESLCSGLSQKISQKILVLEVILDEPPPGRGMGSPATD